MIATKDELIELIRRGELVEHREPNVELKSSWVQEHGKKISAMANRTSTGPQWLCVGISDKGTLCGKSESWAEATEKNISQHVNRCLDPQITCQGISCEQVEGKWFIVIELASPGSVVYWDGAAYKAAGTTMQMMTPEAVMQLTFTLPGLTDYSAQPWNGTYDEHLVREFARDVALKRKDTDLGTVHELDPNVVLERLGISRTITTRILFGNVRYRVVKYDAGGNPIANDTHYGLFGLLRSGFLTEIQQWSKAQIGLVTDPYPAKALKEGLANAVAHAVYFEEDGDVIVELWPGKMSVSNLCVQDSLYFANKWFSRSHKTLNRLLMEALRIAGVVDELGRGKSLIFSESLRNGKKAPEVAVEKGRRYDRWRLTIYGGAQDQAQLRVFERLKRMYSDEHKALIANALVLWRGHTVSNIRQYVDGESSRTFAEVLTDLSGPIFYHREKDEIVLRRWVQVLLGEGKDSKQLSPVEEADLLRFATELQTEYFQGYITPKRLRELAGMGDTRSEGVLSSRLLGKWTEEGKIEKVKRGQYRFIQSEPRPSMEELFKVLAERFNS